MIKEARPSIPGQSLITPIFHRCQEEFSDYQLWPCYYELRYYEFLQLLPLLSGERKRKVLELGCGIGYYAAFLSRFFDEVTATDVEMPSLSLHSNGLARARDLAAGLELDNIRFAAASADQLPFADASFDVVFSSHALGYVADRSKVVAEVGRVLRPGGVHICIVPARAAIAYRVVDYYAYLSRAVVRKLRSKRKAQPSAPAEGTAAGEAKRSSLSHFPFPVPQSGFSSWWDELRQSSPASWRRQLTAQGKIALRHQSTLHFTPWLLASNVVPTSLSLRLYRKTCGWEAKLGRSRWLQPLGLNSVIVTQKELSS